MKARSHNTNVWRYLMQRYEECVNGQRVFHPFLSICIYKYNVRAFIIKYITP